LVGVKSNSKTRPSSEMKGVFSLKNFPNFFLFIEMNIEISDERLKTFLRRRFSAEDLNWIVNDVKEMIDEGESVDTAVYDGVREFIKSKKFPDIDEFGPLQSYWDTFLSYERPLVAYVKSKLNL